MSSMSQPISPPFPPAAVPSLPFFFIFSLHELLHTTMLQLVPSTTFGTSTTSSLSSPPIWGKNQEEGHIRSRSSIFPSDPYNFSSKLVEAHFQCTQSIGYLPAFVLLAFCNLKMPSLCGAQGGCVCDYYCFPKNNHDARTHAPSLFQPLFPLVYSFLELCLPPDSAINRLTVSYCQHEDAYTHQVHDDSGSSGNQNRLLIFHTVMSAVRRLPLSASVQTSGLDICFRP